MTDIVERLRNRTWPEGDTDTEEAADEIERLRAELARHTAAPCNLLAKAHDDDSLDWAALPPLPVYGSDVDDASSSAS